MTPERAREHEARLELEERRIARLRRDLDEAADELRRMPFTDAIQERELAVLRRQLDRGMKEIAEARAELALANGITRP